MRKSGGGRTKLKTKAFICLAIFDLMSALNAAVPTHEALPG